MKDKTRFQNSHLLAFTMACYALTTASCTKSDSLGSVGGNDSSVAGDGRAGDGLLSLAPRAVPNVVPEPRLLGTRPFENLLADLFAFRRVCRRPDIRADIAFPRGLKFSPRRPAGRASLPEGWLSASECRSCGR